MNVNKWYILSLFLFMVNSAFANGNCTGPNGGTNELAAPLGNFTITDPNNNKPGHLIDNAYSWNVPGYVQHCDCPSTSGLSWFFTATTPLSTTADGWLKTTDYIDVKLGMTDSHWNETKYIPFSNIKTHDFTQGEYSTCDIDVNHATDSTGGHGVLSLRISKSFVGYADISNKAVAYLYSCASSNGQCDPVGAATIVYTLSGSVTVPQSCVINAGTQVAIDLGTFYSGDFNTAGQKPRGAVEKTFNVPIKCTNVGAPANLTLRLQATPDSHDVQAIATDNTDVGVVVTNNQSAILTPNDTSSIIPFVTDPTGNATVTLKAYPVSTTGDTPKEGMFTALAYLRIDFA